MIAYSHSPRWPSGCRLLVLLLLMVPSPTTSADDNAATEAPRAAAAKPAEERDQERLLAIRAATLAAIDYAEAHDGAIPTTQQLAKHMGIAPKDFQYRVVLSGPLDKHMERVKGDWPQVLIAEKNGGENDKWAFGYVDGLCTIQSVASYKEMNNSAALDAIEKAKATQPTRSP